MTFPSIEPEAIDTAYHAWVYGMDVKRQKIGPPDAHSAGVAWAVSHVADQLKNVDPLSPAARVDLETRMERLRAECCRLREIVIKYQDRGPLKPTSPAEKYGVPLEGLLADSKPSHLVDSDRLAELQAFKDRWSGMVSAMKSVGMVENAAWVMTHVLKEK